jgi:hypothetical protein
MIRDGIRYEVADSVSADGIKHVMDYISTEQLVTYLPSFVYLLVFGRFIFNHLMPSY